MIGKIIKSIAGFYEVYSEGNVYRCRARGVFRALGEKPLVGDDVEFDVTDTVSVPQEGNVTRILPRRNALIRPNVANVDQALLLFAVTYPAPSFNMLDRFLITMSMRDLPAVLCFNKTDLAAQEDIRALRETYERCGCKVLFISTYQEETLEELSDAYAKFDDPGAGYIERVTHSRGLVATSDMRNQVVITWITQTPSQALWTPYEEDAEGNVVTPGDSRAYPGIPDNCREQHPEMVMPIWGTK